MAFSSVFFLFAFLPASLLIYHLCPTRVRNLVLVVVSLVFYAWGTPTYVVLMAFSIVFNYLAGRAMGPASKKGAGHARPSRGARRAVLVLGIVVDLVLLGFFKYAGFLVENINALAHTSFATVELALPVGISFFTFSAISYLADVYKGRVETEGGLIDVAVYLSFFPKVLSGPIVQYKDMAAQIAERHVSRAQLDEGARLFMVGLGKKVLIADCLATTYSALAALPVGGLSTLSAWLGCVCYTLVIYFDFSGYSDMAIGVSKLFGFDVAANFDHPYVSMSATEFWRRWHISLGRWFRDYVYIPLGGNRVSTAAHVRNIAIVWLLTGLWHGAAWHFVAWGGFYGVLILIEKYLLKPHADKIARPVRHVGAMLAVMVGWVLFFSPSLSAALAWLGAMVGVGTGSAGVIDSTGLYYLGQSIVLLVVGAVGATPLVTTMARRLTSSHPGIARLAGAFACAAVLVLSTAYLVNSTYSSFLYFKF